MNARRGFTLIEMMIVVAIIGILASIAIPNFQQYVLRSKQTEGLTVLQMLRTAEDTWRAAHDCFANTEAQPAAIPSATTEVWASVASSSPVDCSVTVTMEDMNVRPAKTSVYYQYQCMAQNTALQVSDYVCSAYGDLDANGVYYELVYGTDYDRDGSTIASAHGSVSGFPYEYIRVSLGRY